ncbi:uncharacterized protein LOC143026656 isoform X2 [Oratosquilla oratoria]|uniref:uncharacterized protein LOC143026656 isoform X2 n=1 Tax=Oratosquilla oratoria TaxID=337810 RepID=UPI003F757357
MAYPSLLKIPLCHRKLITKFCSGQGFLLTRQYAGVCPFPALADSIDSWSSSLEAAEKKAFQLIGEVKKLSLLCVAGGGERGVATHVKKNRKVLVRERLAKLFDDEDDFLEICLLAGIGMEYGDIPAAGMVCGAYCPTMCEDSAIVDRIGTVFLGGPPLVKAATGEEVSAEDLGGATLHSSVSGCTDYFAATEEEGILAVRDVVATLNINHNGKPLNFEEPLYSTADLNVLCGLDTMDMTAMYGIIARLVDGSRFRDFKKLYGKNLIAGYALLEGRAIGILANAGNLTYEDGLKGSHFVQICQQRGIPIIFLQNSGKSGAVAMGKEPLERAQGLKGKGAMMAAVSCASVPKITINVGGCHSDDNYTMCGSSFNPNFNFAWPGATVTHTLNPPPVPPPPKSEDKKNEERGKKVKKRPPISAFNFTTSSALFQASRSLIDGIIIPANTRKVVTQCLRICRQRQQMVLSSKNFPVFRM